MGCQMDYMKTYCLCDHLQMNLDGSIHNFHCRYRPVYLVNLHYYSVSTIV